MTIVTFPAEKHSIDLANKHIFYILINNIILLGTYKILFDKCMIRTL